MSEIEQNRTPKDQISYVINLYSKGYIEKAIHFLKNLIVEYPKDPLLFNIYGACHAFLRQFDEAVQCYEAALSIEPNYAEVHNNLGIVLKDLGEFEKAIESFNKAINNKPNYFEAYNNLGTSFHLKGYLDKAAKSYKHALSIKPAYSEALNNLGNVYRELNKLDSAVESYLSALEAEPNYAIAHFNLGIAFKELGRRDLAIESFNKAIAIKPDYVKAHHSISTLKKYTKEDHQVLQMKSLLQSNKLSLSESVHLCFALAKVYLNLEIMEQYFHFLHLGNQLRKKELKYSINDDKKLFIQLKDIFIKAPVLNLDLTDKQPIFIVGMPRSGTTLVEQILASHNLVYGAGELTAIPDLVEPLIEDLLEKNKNTLNKQNLISIRKAYQNHISNFNNDENIITDKLPLNFLYIGFILSAFPEAKVIHLKRDAVATCWSNYKCFFIDRSNGYSYDFDDLSEFYNLYLDLMKFWHQRYPNKIYDVSYEDLTNNQEKETRKLLEYCDLNWDDNCLNFHKNNRAVKTASALQVRKKMYQGSSEAWKKYEEYLGPLIKGLNY